MANDNKWLGVHQGNLFVRALIRPSSQGKSALYRARCTCGRYIVLTASALEEGIDNCGCESSIGDKAELRLAPNLAKAHLPDAIVKVYAGCEYKCPGWWKSSLPDVVESMTNMLARGHYTNEYLAKWWKCPVGFVDAVEKHNARRIGTIKEELEDCKKLLDGVIGKPAPDGFHTIGAEWGGIASLRMTLSGRSLYSRLSRRDSEL